MTHHDHEDPAAAPIADRVVARFLEAVGTGRTDEVTQALAASPGIVNAVGPHPFWGGRPQALHVAIEGKRRDMVGLLLAAGADVDGSNDQYDHWSPLMLAIDRKASDIQDDLRRRGARVGLMEALMLADDALAEALLRPGASALPSYAPNGGSILSFARTPFAIDRLIALGASTDVKDRWGSSPIDAMSRMGAAGQPLVRHLIAHGVSAAPEEFARLGDRPALELLIAADPAVAASDAVMMGGVDFGHHALVEWLLGRGANVNARARAQSKHTALHSAAWNGDLPMVKLLVAAGADREALDEEHRGTPLQWAEVAIGVRNDPACQAVADYLSALSR